MRIGIDGAIGGGISELNGGKFWTGAIIASTISSARVLYRGSIALVDKTKVRDPFFSPSNGQAGIKGLEQDVWIPDQNGYGNSNAGYGVHSIKDPQGIFSEPSPLMKSLSLVR